MPQASYDTCMTVLFRWMFISSMVRIIAIAVAIILLFMVAESFAKAPLLDKGMTLNLLLEYLILKVPFMVSDFMPVIVLIGTSIYMAEISHHHELVAIRAAGISMPVLLRPLLLAAACVSFFTFAMGEWVEPVTNQRLSYLERVYMDGEEGVQHQGVQWFRDDSKYMRLTPLQGKYFSLMVLETDEKGAWAGRTDAKKAFYDRGVWQLEHVFISKPSAERGIVTQQLDSMQLASSIQPETAEPPKPRDMHWLELYHFAKSLANAGLDADEYQYQLQRKIAGPLACFIMVILAFSLCGNMGSRISANSKGLIFALILGVVFYIFATSVRVLVDGGNLPIIYAAWWPNILFFGLAGYLLLQREGY